MGKVHDILSILESSDEPVGISYLQQVLGINSRRRLEEIIKKAMQIAKRSGRKLEFIPARCKDCGYEFSRKEFKIPSKCPVCGSEWIEEPKIFLGED